MQPLPYTCLTHKMLDATQCNQKTNLNEINIMTNKAIDDCFRHDKDRLTHHQALDILKSNIKPLTKTQKINTSMALNQVLTNDETAPRPIPAHTNAAVDGYAFAHNDYNPETGSTFKISNRITAGAPQLKTIEPATATRIFTGAPMPTTLDSVVMQEDVTLSQNDDGSNWVTIPAGLKPNANCRQAGEDTKQDGLLVKAGTRLKPQHIAALASAGINDIEINQPIKVASLSTGNELIRDEKQFVLGKVFDSNGPMIRALASAQNCPITDLGIIKDHPAAIEQTLSEAATKYDVIITSGGASKGEEDHMVTSLQKLGTQHMWQLAIKPGRPMSFGQIGNCIMIGLPGNPVAAFICFLLYASPLLRRLTGEAWSEPPRFQIPANFKIDKKKPDRREFMRGTLITKNGETWVEKYDRDGSGLIHSLTTANGLIEIEETTTSLELGERVNFISFSHWGV